MNTGPVPATLSARLAHAPFVLGLLALLAAHSLLLFQWSRPPFEDAAMLLRYAKHLAAGYGIVWNAGEAPVDGATDFLFMTAVAGLAHAGLRPEAAARALAFVAHALTVLLVYAGIRRFYGVSRWYAFFTSAFLLLGPGLRYVEVHFGTPFFAFLSCLSWFFALELICRPPAPGSSMAFAAAALAAALTRPEGVFLGMLQLASVVYARGWRASRRSVALFLLPFLVLGGGYLLWRLQYFGALLPNPFYAKGGGGLHPDSLRAAVGNTATLVLPLLPVFALALATAVISFAREIDQARVTRLLRGLGAACLFLFVLGIFHSSNPAVHPQLVLGRYSRGYATLLALLLGAGGLGLVRAWYLPRLLGRWLPRERVPQTARAHYYAHVRRWTVIAAIPIVGFMLVWVLIQDVMNYLMRFQYPLLPIACLVWPALLVGAAEAFPALGRVRRARAAAVVSAGVLVAGAVVLQRSVMGVSDGFRDGRYDVARMLHEYSRYGYTMATTEAGLLPYYSEWRAIDLFGYNDRWIARHQQVSEEYLDRYRPELIVMATRFPLGAPGDAPRGSWYSIMGTIERYAEQNGYVLAAAFGADPRKVHYYYVKREFPHAGEIARRIRALDYTWYMSGKRAHDFARPRDRDLRRGGAIRDRVTRDVNADAAPTRHPCTSPPQEPSRRRQRLGVVAPPSIARRGLAARTR